MQINLSTPFLKYAFNALCSLTMVLTVALISNGVLAFGGSGSVKGAYLIASLTYLIIFVAIFGVFAALRQSKTLTKIFIGATAFFVVLEIVFMITFAAMKDDFMEMTVERIGSIWKDEAAHPGSMDLIHAKYNCCGKDSPQDFLQDDDDVLPKSCCLYNDCTNSSNIYTKGCAVTTINFFDKYSDNLILTFVGLIAIQVVSIVCAYFYDKNLMLKKERGASISE